MRTRKVARQFAKQAIHTPQQEMVGDTLYKVIESPHWKFDWENNWRFGHAILFDTYDQTYWKINAHKDYDSPNYEYNLSMVQVYQKEIITYTWEAVE